MNIDLGWHWQLVTNTKGEVVWAWAHWSKRDLLSERSCDAISFTTERPEGR